MFTNSTDNLISLSSGPAVSLARVAVRHGHRDVDVAVDWTVDRGVSEPEPVDRRAARCGDGHGTLTYLFFSDELLDIARAKAICRKCSQAPVCLTGALERSEPWGVWGGELLTNGEIVVNKRPRGRPPKHPRPELVVDEVPFALLRSVGGAERVKSA